MISLKLPTRSSNPFIDPDLTEAFGGLAGPKQARRFKKMTFCALSYYGKDAPPPTPAAMTREEEKELFFKYRKRRTAKTRDLLIRHYLCWAFGMAAKLKGPRLDIDEAISVANEGLMEALDGFDPSKGFRFTTYATFVLRRKLIAALISTYPVRISDHVRKKWRELEESSETLAMEMLKDGDEPRTLEEFFERLGETSEIDVALLHERPEDAPFMPPPAEDPAVASERVSQLGELETAIKRLTIVEQKVVRARHSETPDSYVIIARRLKISKSSARDCYDLALTKLRKFFAQESR